MPPLSDLSLRWALLTDRLRRPPGHWPAAWRRCGVIAAPLGVLALGAALLLQPQWDELQAAQLRESQLKALLLGQLQQAAALPDVLRHRQALGNSLTALGRGLLPAGDAAGVEALLAQLNQLGAARGLRFDKFQRNAEVAQAGFTALPVALHASGSFADVLGFVGDVARLPQLVTLSGLQVQARPQDGAIVLEASATIYRQPAAMMPAAQGLQP